MDDENLDHVPRTASLPWFSALPAADQQEFCAQFAETSRIASDLGNPELLDVLLSQWKNTAFVHADPTLRARLIADPDTDKIVPRPAIEALEDGIL